MSMQCCPIYLQRLMQSMSDLSCAFHSSISGLEATWADEGECFVLDAVTKMIAASLKWKQALGFQKDGLLTPLLRCIQALLVSGCSTA